MNQIRELRLPRLISDGMVLNRNGIANIWGYAIPGDTICIHFLEKVSEAKASEDGKWKVSFLNLPPGGPHTMKISAKTSGEIELKDILIGDVFLSSGQSNMEVPMERVKDLYPEEMINCRNNNLRLFKVKEKYHFPYPLQDLESGTWKSAAPSDIAEFSAVSYFFEKFLYESTSVPVGVINASLGGSPIQAWLGEEELSEYPAYMEELNAYKDDQLIEAELARNIKQSEEWYQALEKADKGLNENIPWYAEVVRADGWSEIELPGFFQEAGILDFTGSIWFRKTITLSETMAGRSASLWLGTIVDSDTVYVNGVYIGGTPYQYPPRKYQIPEGVLKAGDNVIAVRVICDNGKGRFTPGKIYRLFPEKEYTITEKKRRLEESINLKKYINSEKRSRESINIERSTFLKESNCLEESNKIGESNSLEKSNKIGESNSLEKSNRIGESYSLEKSISLEESISLEGNWYYKIGAKCANKPTANFISWKPAGLYNGMINPCHEYSLSGVLWYQGESNTGQPSGYSELFQKLITSWRRKWQQEDLPFLFVQLPNFEIDIAEGDEGWPALREEQRSVLSLPGTAMVVAIDLGEANDLHPLRKKDIGYRLSLAARFLVLKEQLEYSGPILKTVETVIDTEDNKIILTFSHTGEGLVSGDGSKHPGNFQIVGEDGCITRAEAVIQEESVILTYKASVKPKYIRYAYTNSPKEELLYNLSNLPASPFVICLN